MSFPSDSVGLNFSQAAGLDSVSSWQLVWAPSSLQPGLFTLRKKAPRESAQCQGFPEAVLTCLSFLPAYGWNVLILQLTVTQQSYICIPKQYKEVVEINEGLVTRLVRNVCKRQSSLVLL